MSNFEIKLKENKMADAAWFKTFFASLDDTFFSDVKFEGLAYQGFDPEFLIITLRNRANVKGRRDDQFKKDLAFLAAVGTMRGSQLQKIQNKSQTGMVNKLRDMIATYALTAKPTTNESATLPRIAACFARELSKELCKSGTSLKPTIGESKMPIHFPAGLRLSVVGALIPEGDQFANIDDASAMLNGWLYHQKLFDQVINSKPANKNKDPKVRLAAVEEFGMIQYSSNLYNKNDRANH